MIVLGIDPATTRIAVADEAGRCAYVDVPRGEDGARRMAKIHSATQKIVHEFIADECPDICFIESPAGHVHPSLWQAFGVIGAAAWVTLSTVERFPVTVLAIGPSEWKRVLVDNGAATKAEIMDWAREQGYDGKVQDEADALGIARAGFRLLRSRPGA